MKPKLSAGFVSLMVILPMAANAQGPAPETAAPLFPKGALVSYASGFVTRDRSTTPAITSTSHPTFSHQADFVFTWGFYPNFDLTVKMPVVTNEFDGVQDVRGTAIGDAMVLVKYRFYRSDSERGTSQLSTTVGPKLATGGTDLRDSRGIVLPASLQPGSGSTDFFWALNWTYTGLFNIRRLVVDEDFHSLIRTTGTQQTNLGNEFASRLWISYRPYESKDVRREWFIGPTLTWMHSNDQKIAGVEQNGSGGDALLAGVTTYFGVSPGVHVWFGIQWDVAHTDGESFQPSGRQISVGITRQFRFI
jgi:hypothetical protein